MLSFHWHAHICHIRVWSGNGFQIFPVASQTHFVANFEGHPALIEGGIYVTTFKVYTVEARTNPLLIDNHESQILCN